MNRNQIQADAIVRQRPSNSRYNTFYGSNIGRLVSGEPVSMRSVGYYGKQAAIVAVEWYATLKEDGTIRTWEEPRIEQADSRKLEVIDLPKLAAELAGWHATREDGRREVRENEALTEANIATMRTILNDERWGYSMNDGRTVKISDKELAALVALVSKVVAS